MSSPERCDALVVGAGLAGLSCAVHLTGHGKDVRLLEAAEAPGGRVRTDAVDGFLLDRGFQVLMSSYDEARAILDFEELDLQPFHPGALVWREGRLHRLADPRRHAGALLSTLLAPVGGWADKLAVLRLGRLLRARSDLPAWSAAHVLEQAGFSQRFLEAFLQPFLGGVFLERGLQTCAARLATVWEHFTRGEAVVPAEGMGAIPRQLARRLPAGTLRCGAPVASVQPGRVVLEDGGVLEAEAVVLATDEPAARRLLGAAAPQALGAPRPWHGVTNLSFDAPRSPVQGPWLVLDGSGEGPVNNLHVPSELSRTFAPMGHHLVSATVLGVPAEDDERLAAACRAQLGRWFGPQVDDWRLLAVRRIPRALPASPPASGAQDRPAGALAPGLHLCGDHMEGPSIDGALRSGRRAADAVLAAEVLAPA